jgi:ABC-type multidrug transport system ATPase subunit
MKIEIKNLCKKYGNTPALDNISICLKEGIYGILGENGAGKTTLLNLLTDNIKRDTGQILLDGEDILQMGIAYRRLIGYMPQQQGLYDQMTASAFMYYIAELKELKKKEAQVQIDDLFAVTNLMQVRSKKISALSGMKQRLLLAQALLSNPVILFLDEPTAGLDPKERIRIRNYIASISKGRIIILATHIVGDLELIANQIIMLKKGRVIKMSEQGALIAAVQDKVKEYEFSVNDLENPTSTYHRIQQQYKVSNIFVANDKLQVRLVGDNLPKGGKSITNHTTLEDVYLYYLAEE